MVIHPPIPGVKSINAIIKKDKSKYLLFTGSKGILEFNGGIKSIFTEHTDTFSDAIINSAIRLQSGDIAIGTQNSGLFIISAGGELKLHLNNDQGLESRTVLSLYEDRFSNLWVGLNNGINYLELNSPFSIIDERAGLPGTGYTAHYQNGHLYLGTSNGLYYSQMGGSSQLSLIAGTEGQVYNLSEVNNQLYLAHHTGAFIVNDGKATRFFGETGTWKFSPFKNQEYVLGGTYDGFYLFSDKQLDLPKTVFKISDLNEPSRVFELEGQDIWMTHGYKGVFQLKFNESDLSRPVINFYDHTNGFPSNILINVFEINNDLVYTAEKGLYKYNASQDLFEPDSLTMELINDDRHVSFLREDVFGNIYFISGGEIGILRKNNLGGYKKETAIFKRINSFISDDLGNINVLNHQNVLFAARDGFIHYNPLKEIPSNTKSKTLLTTVEVSGSKNLAYRYPHSLSHEAQRFSFNQNNIKFSFTSPDFSSSYNITYAYKLEGFDDNWSDFSPQNFKEYTNLPSRDFKMLVRSKDIAGNVSESQAYSFTVLPPWYRTPTAYVIVVMLFFAVFGLAIVSVDRKHRFERQRSEQEQQKVIIDKDNQLQQVAKKSEQQISQLKNEKLKVEIQHKNKELATATMHLLNKNDFMNGLKNRLKHLKDGAEHKEIKDIIKEIEKNISDDDDWKHFEIHFDNVHSEFLKRIKEHYPQLSQQDIKLAAFLRMNMSSKEIASLLNISVRGVEISRYRLRKKLELDRDINLVEFMMDFKGETQQGGSE